MPHWIIRTESTYVVEAYSEEEAVEIWENDPDGLRDSRIGWEQTVMESVERVAE